MTAVHGFALDCPKRIPVDGVVNSVCCRCYVAQRGLYGDPAIAARSSASARRSPNGCARRNRQTTRHCRRSIRRTGRSGRRPRCRGFRWRHCFNFFSPAVRRRTCSNPCARRRACSPPPSAPRQGREGATDLWTRQQITSLVAARRRHPADHCPRLSRQCRPGAGLAASGGRCGVMSSTGQHATVLANDVSGTNGRAISVPDEARFPPPRVRAAADPRFRPEWR